MRYASVCSGVEAASLAWAPLGWKPVFFAEVEPFPCAVLQQRFNATKPLHPLDPAEASDEKDRKMRESWLKQINKLPDTGTIPNLGDFTKIKGEDYVGAIDLLVGGTPCQDLSVAGKRAGFEGARSSLALDFVRLAYEARCQYFVWENVPGVFSSNGGGDFATLLSYFCGYTVDVPKDGWKSSGIVQNRRPDRYGLAWRVLDAQFTRVSGFPFAVPQRRRRVFLVGCLGDWERAASILLEPDRLSWDNPPRIKTREILAGGAGDCTASAIRMRAGCDGEGKGALVGDNLSHTLQTGNDQTIVESGEVSSTIDASYYKGVDHKRQICMDVAGTLKARNGASPYPERGQTVVSQFWNGSDVAESVTTTSNNQRMPDKGRMQMVVANVFTMDADASNSMKSANPNSGFHEADVAKTLDTTVPTPQKAQGGQMIMCFHGSQDPISNETNANAIGRNGGLENCICYDARGNNVAQPLSLNNGGLHYIATYEHHPQDSRLKETEVGPTCGTFGNSIEGKDCIVQSVAIAENIIGRKAENGGNGVGAQEELAYTQNATGVMGVASINLNKETENGYAEKTRPSEILRLLRETLGEKAFSKWLGRHGSVSQEEILQSEMHGGGVRCKAEPNEGEKHLPLPCEEACPAREMRNLWEGECIGRAPQGRRLHEQRPVESDSAVPELPHQSASSSEILCNMWGTVQGAWILREALAEIQKVRKSASVQTESVRPHPCRTVRRLLVTECEALMGFPDNHTRISWNGKSEEDCPDAPRYKACGNSFCCNVVEWIGRRIDMFDEPKERKQCKS